VAATPTQRRRIISKILRPVHPKQVLIDRIIGRISPSWKAQLLWAQQNGDRPGKAVVDAVVRRGDVAVDLGANVGLYTDRLARLVGIEGRVYAFEPHPLFEKALKRIAGRRKNVVCIQKAVSSEASTNARMAVPVLADGPDYAMGTLEERGPAQTVRVATTTLDIALHGVTPVRFIKCDVEGHEHEVLTGAQDVLKRERPILFIEIEQRHRQRPLEETFDLLQHLGYDGYMMTPGGPRPLAEFDVERDQWALIAADPTQARPPSSYVNDFLFLSRGSPLPI